MRDDIPVDYERKKEEFICILAKVVHENAIPDELIINFDETNCQFIPTVSRTRCPKGTKRIRCDNYFIYGDNNLLLRECLSRVIGIGKEKPQITVGIAVSATGNVIEPTQLIFAGKTRACLPNKGKTPPVEGQYHTYTTSHWQTVESFIEYIDKEDLGIVDDDGDDDINANPMNELSHFDIEVNVDHSDSDSEASESLLDELGTEALNSSSAYSKVLTIL
jgi:hypothetical protein